MAREVLKAKLDIIFKKIFTENIDMLTSFLSSVLNISEERISDIRIVNSEIPPESIFGKFSRLDLNMEADGRLVNVEVQVNSDRTYRDRSLYYWASLFTSGIKSGDMYDKLKQTITINILNFDLFGGEGYHYEVKPVTEETGEVFSDKMKMYFFELSKLPDSRDNSDLRELWLRFIASESEEEYEMIRQTDVPIMKKAVKVIYDMSEDAKIREEARLREKALHDEASLLGAAREEGREKGRAEGRQAERAAMIAEMRKKGLSEELIASIAKGAGIGSGGE